MALAPSGGSGASQPCSAANTRSAGTIASAGPPLPWPSNTDTVGVSSVTRSARQRAISPARPSCSASTVSAGPAVSMTSTSGSCRPAASAMPRRATRNAAGPTRRAGAGGTTRIEPGPPMTRCCPSTTAGWPPNLASASSVVASSPRPVPDSSTRSDVPCRNRYPTPGRSGRRDASTDSHAGTSGTGAASGNGGGTSGGSATTFSVRSSVERNASSGTTPSMTPWRSQILGGLDVRQGTARRRGARTHAGRGIR